MEQVVYRAVLSGELIVDHQGRIWRVKARRGKKDGTTHLVSCQRRRAEHKTLNGYLQVRMMRDGKQFSAMAHRLVFLALNGPITKGMTINHKNYNRADNRPSNLEQVTMSQNRQHAANRGKPDAT